MGIDVGSALVVGLPFYDVVEDGDEYYEKYAGELDNISPYYDADRGDRVLGYKLAGTDYTYDEVNPEELLKNVLEAKEKFLKLTGKEAKVYVSPHVW